MPPRAEQRRWAHGPTPISSPVYPTVTRPALAASPEAGVPFWRVPPAVPFIRLRYDQEMIGAPPNSVMGAPRPIRAAAIGREISCRVFGVFFDAIQQKGLGPAVLVAGTGHGVAELSVAYRALPWTVFVTFMKNAGKVWTPDELRDIGSAVFYNRYFRPIGVIANLLYSVTEFYAWVFEREGPASGAFAAIESNVAILGPGRVRIEARLRPGYEPSEENWFVLEGTLRGMSVVLGRSPARVQRTAVPHGQAFDVEVEDGGGWFAALRRWSGWLVSSRRAGAQLEDAYMALNERYVELANEFAAREQAEAQLVHAQRLESMGRLAGGVAHDFNNLLTVILGYSDLLKESAEGGTIEDVEQIRLAAERGRAITRQLLAFSRQQVLELSVVDLGDVVEGASKLLGRILGEDIVLSVKRGANLGLVRVDVTHIEQVLMNLAVNARDAMPRGGRLDIELSCGEPDPRALGPVVPGRYTRLSVSDSGAGMDLATQARVFEPFFTTKATGQGTGLGLAIVYGIVRQCGGFVTVHSEPGRGARFDVYLPVVDEGLTPRVARPDSAQRGTETVLVVDDNPAVRALAERLLRALGYRVIGAAGSEEALRVLEAAPERIAVLLTDVQMPGMNGVDLAARCLAVSPGLRVLYMSGHAPGALEHLSASGSAFLAKPFSTPELAAKLRQVLDDATGPGSG